jgi:anti-sigma factor RsiW
MTPLSRTTEALIALADGSSPAAELLREVERMAHGITDDAAGADVAELRALHIAAARLKARIAARVATLTVLRDAMRAADRARAGSVRLYDATGRQSRV